MAYLESVPKYAFGTAFDVGEGENRISENDLKDFMQQAIKLGCRHFDCAPLYKTQNIVGTVLKEAMRTLPRNDFFITSKLPPNMMRLDNIERSIRNTLQELQLCYLDCFLIHAPFSTKYISDDEIYPTDNEGNVLLDEEDGILEEAWLKLVDLKRQGLTRYIGLSNVNIEQLIRINKIHQIDFVQNEYHMYNQDREIFDFCEEIDVHYEAYAAFGCPPKSNLENKPCFVNDPVVKRVARDNNLSIAQVNMQWIHQQPLSYVIKCDNIAQLKENLKAMSMQSVPLNDMIDLDGLNKNVRLYKFDEHRGLSRHREYPFRKLPAGLHKEPFGQLNQPVDERPEVIYHHQNRAQEQVNAPQGVYMETTNKTPTHADGQSNNNINPGDLKGGDTISGEKTLQRIVD